MDLRLSKLNQQGVALLLVLWVLAFLMVIVAEFCRTMRTEVNIARNFKEMTQALYAARSGMNLAFLAVVQEIAKPASVPTESRLSGVEGIDWRINTALPPIPFAEGGIHVRIENESGKINLNLAETSLLRLLVSGLDLSDKEKNIIVDSILDWRDKDSSHRLNGAEDGYYQSLATPYNCKNSDFDSIEELMRVRGVTPEIFFNGLSKRVTVYPTLKEAESQLGFTKRKKKTKEGYDFNKINVNAARSEVLKVLPGFDDEIVDAINSYRQEKDIVSTSDLISVIGAKGYLSARSYITFELSPYYAIKAFGVLDDGKVRQGVSAVVRVDLKSKEKYSIVQWIDNVAQSYRTIGLDEASITN